MSDVPPAPEAAAEPAGRRSYRPAADILETESGFTLTLEMPGVAPEGVDVEIEGRTLLVRGQSVPRTPEGQRLVHAEYIEGDFERVFTLSRRLDPDRVTAEMRDGVLTLTLPRAEAERASRIAVRAG